jgi:hypothetical protein
MGAQARRNLARLPRTGCRICRDANLKRSCFVPLPLWSMPEASYLISNPVTLSPCKNSMGSADVISVPSVPLVKCRKPKSQVATMTERPIKKIKPERRAVGLSHFRYIRRKNSTDFPHIECSLTCIELRGSFNRQLLTTCQKQHTNWCCERGLNSRPLPYQGVEAYLPGVSPVSTISMSLNLRSIFDIFCF